MNDFVNTKFIYISTMGYCNVFLSQVVDWLHLYQEKGIVFELWLISSIKKLVIDNSFERKETKLIREIYKNKVQKFYFAPLNNFMGDIFNTALLILRTISILIQRKDIVIQIRSPYLHRNLKFIKAISRRRVKIIFDSRAALAEEFIYSYRGDNSKRFKKEAERISKDEMRMIQISDKIFCVSEVLISYHMKKNPQTNRSRYFLYPCSSNSSYFFYSQEYRSLMRKQMHIEKKRVVVYSGSLKFPWTIPNKIFELFEGLYSLDENYFFMMLTPDTKIAGKYLLNYRNLKASILITSVNGNNMVKYLCAADLALLLREDVPMNNVSSPTKFAEYVLTGLPVIISQNVGDFSNFVSENDLGYVFNNDFSKSNIYNMHLALNEKAKLFSAKRSKIAELGLNKYEKNKNLERILAQYFSLMV